MILFPLLLASALQQPVSELRLETYRARVGAAESAVRLHEYTRAREWLDGADPDLRGWEWHYLRRQTDRAQATWSPRESTLLGLDLSPDGALLAGSFADGAILVWALPEMKVQASLEGHTAAVYTARFSPDGLQLVSASRDKTARVWDVASGRQLREFEGNSNALGCADWHPDGRRIASSSWRRTGNGAEVRGEVKIWDAGTGQIDHDLDAWIKPTGHLVFTPDGKQLAITSWDGVVSLFDLSEANPESLELKVPENESYRAVYGLDVSPDGKLLAGAGNDGYVTIWTLPSGDLHSSTEVSLDSLRVAAFTADGESVLAAGDDDVVWRIPIAAPHAPQALPGHGAAVRALAVDADRGVFYSGGADHTLRRWSADFGAYDGVHAGEAEDSAWTASWTRDGSRFGVSLFDGTARIMDAATGAVVHEWRADDGEIHGLALSPEGTRALVWGWDGVVRIFTVGVEAPLREFTDADRGGSYHAGWSKDGALVAAVIGSKVRMWNLANSEVRAELEHPDSLTRVAFSPDGALLATAARDGVVRVWSAEDGALRAELTGHGGAVSGLAWRADGARLASCDGSGEVRIWDPKAEQLVRLAWDTDVGLTNLDYSPDGKRLAVAAGKALALVDAEHGGLVLELRPYRDTVWDVAFAPDGARLIPVTNRGPLRVLDSGAPSKWAWPR
ncbi:MAG TPA: WD40 repeat domain-containing protein [Planctomycetota bacterium]